MLSAEGTKTMPKAKKNRAGRKWFDGKNEKTVLAKCKEVWAYDGTDAEAAFYAEVSKDSISRYLKEHDDVRELRDRLKERPILQARKTVVENLNNPHIALRYLERKRKDEFALRQEHTGPSGEPISREMSDEDKALVKRALSFAFAGRARKSNNITKRQKEPPIKRKPSSR